MIPAPFDDRYDPDCSDEDARSDARADEILDRERAIARARAGLPPEGVHRERRDSKQTTTAERWAELQRQRAEDAEKREAWEGWQRDVIDRDFRMQIEILNELRRIKALLSGTRS